MSNSELPATASVPNSEASERTDLTRREMYAEIKKLCALRDLQSWKAIAFEYALYAAIVTTCTLVYHWLVANGWSRLWILPVYLPTVLAIGFGSQNRLGSLIHESSHFMLLKNRTWNDVIANVLVCYPLFAQISNYRAGHWGHHRHVNDPEKDPDLKRLQKHHRRDFPVGKRRFLREYLLLQLMPHKAYSYLKGRAEYIAFGIESGQAKKQKDEPIRQPWLTIMRVGYYVSLAILLTIMGWWVHYFCFWLVPIATVYPAALFLREIAHHGNYPDNGDYTNSRVYEGYAWERTLMFPYGEWNHVLHHMFPKVPWYNLRQAHEAMMRFPYYRQNVVICDGYFIKGPNGDELPTVLDILANPSRTYLSGEEQDEGSLAEIRTTEATDSGDLKAPKSDLVAGES